MNPLDAIPSFKRHARVAAAGDVRRAAPRLAAAEAMPVSLEAVPQWARAMLGPCPDVSMHKWQSQTVHLHRGRDACILSVSLAGAAAASPDQLMQHAASSYEALLGLLAKLATPSQRAWQPWRFWNLVPGICQTDAQGLHRYMHFNAGRFQGLARHYLGEQALPVTCDKAEESSRTMMQQLGPSIVAASAVDSHTRDLRIHLLAGRSPALAVENPRQVAAYQYSPRYGPLPPCFARAVKVNHLDTTLLIVSGTASIVGEDSTHQAQLHEQVMEIAANFDALVKQSQTRQAQTGGRDAIWSSQCMTHLRIYLPSMTHRDEVARLLREHVSGDAPMEFCHADLCRPELLVEIEALATLSEQPSDESACEAANFSQGDPS